LQLGQGPDATGGQNDWTDPIIIATDVGCPYPGSVLLTPDGIIFQSLKGMYLLDRGLQTHYIGADVEATLNSNGPIVGAVLTDTDHQARFLTTTGNSIVYDLYMRQWYEFGYSKAPNCGVIDPIGGNASVLYGVFNGVVQESRGLATRTDDSANVFITAQTGWIHLTEMQGYERFYKLLLLGNVYNALTLTIYLDYDYSTVNRQTVTVNFSGSQEPMQIRIFPNIQKAEAIRITIIESGAGDTGQGFDLSGLALEVGLKSGLKKLGPSSTFG
jgi:hypothetical protein